MNRVRGTNILVLIAAETIPLALKAVIRMIKNNNTRSRVNLVHSILLCSILYLFSEKNLIAETLENKNPFLPTGYGNKNISVSQPAPQTSGAISKLVEFRGFITLNNVTQFSLYNKRDSKGYWISQNQSEGGISIRHFDERSKAVTISMNGNTERLTLMSATSTPLPVLSSYNQPVNPPNSPSTQENVRAKPEENRRVIPRRRVILPKP